MEVPLKWLQQIEIMHFAQNSRTFKKITGKTNNELTKTTKFRATIKFKVYHKMRKTFLIKLIS